MLNIPLQSTVRLSGGRKPTGAKLALKPVHVWGIRIRLQVALRARDLALFDLALDSKLRGCDLVALKVSDLVSASGVRSRVMILQRKTGRPVQFEVTEQSRPAAGLPLGSAKKGSLEMFGYSRAGARKVLTSASASMPVWWIDGSRSSGSIPPLTARTACAAQRYRCSTRNWQPARLPAPPWPYEA
jgi:hypothetical protein